MCLFSVREVGELSDRSCVLQVERSCRNTAAVQSTVSRRMMKKRVNGFGLNSRLAFRNDHLRGIRSMQWSPLPNEVERASDRYSQSRNTNYCEEGWKGRGDSDQAYTRAPQVVRVAKICRIDREPVRASCRRCHGNAASPCRQCTSQAGKRGSSVACPYDFASWRITRD